MGIMDAIRRTKTPDMKEILSLPAKTKQAVKNQKLNSINVRYFDRHCRKFITTIGVIEHKTDIPLVYWDNPFKLGGIMFDESVYYDINNDPWIDFIEDYPFGLAYKSELQTFLNVEYLNAVAGDQLDREYSEYMINRGNTAYMIPLSLNKIPREIIRIEIDSVMISKNEAYVKQKMQITQWLVRQMGNIPMYERVGKKDNSFIIFGVILGFLPGVIVGMIVYGSWLR
jgi:hypothetical protein